MAKRDFYEVLGVGKDASDGDIKKAYRALAMKYHPDRNVGDEDAAARFKEAAEAYAVLSDGQKRQMYDRYGHAGLTGAGAAEFNQDAIFETFGDLFGGLFGGGGRRRRGPQPGQSLGYELEIELIEAYRGAKKEITIPRKEACGECRGSGAKPGTSPAICKMCKGAGATVVSQGFFRIQQTCRGCGGSGAVITDPCPTCRGRGQVAVQRTLEVQIPPGAHHGLRMIFRGEGEAGDPGAPRGDLIVELHVRPHKMFKRDGEHLYCEVPVTFSQAALGGEIQVPTLDGPMPFALKPGVQSGEVVRIQGKGMPSLRGGRRGDLNVIVHLETPRTLTKRQEELFRELAEIDKKHVSAHRKSFLEKIRDLFVPPETDEPAAQAETKE